MNGHGVNVVVCDDQLDIRRELATALRAKGLKVYQARGGGEALRYIQLDSVGVAVIDLKMPRMDGIETAMEIRKIAPTVRIIFLTAFDNADYRNRSEKAELQVECWLDKMPNWLDGATYAVLRALGRNFQGEVAKGLAAAAQEGQISAKQYEIIMKHLPSVIPPGLQIRSSPPKHQDIQFTDNSLELGEVLRRLACCLDEAWLGFSDPAHRQLTWDQLRDIASKHLWAAVELLEHDQYRQQLAGQLGRLIGKVEAHNLRLEHIHAVRLSIERLQSEHVNRGDVSACKRAWRHAGVEALPSFHRILQEWEELYRVEGPEADPDEDIAGDDGSIAPSDG